MEKSTKVSFALIWTLPSSGVPPTPPTLHLLLIGLDFLPAGGCRSAQGKPRTRLPPPVPSSHPRQVTKLRLHDHGTGEDTHQLCTVPPPPRGRASPALRVSGAGTQMPGVAIPPLGSQPQKLVPRAA